ncbi:MAG: hypothetical protein J3T61_03715 [Candidatus Brocadiales bacterium]|nr:hypothetical protein [Candidatus Bathyanammoxibius sp.]
MADTSLVKTIPQSLVETEKDACWEVLEPSQTSPTGMKIIRVPFPQDLEQLSPAQEAIILLSQKAWAGNSFAFMMSLILQARNLGLKVSMGELYSVDGRISTSDEAKIRNARSSGKIEYMTVGDLQPKKNPVTSKEDICCVATIKHADESEAQSYTGWLSEWRNSKNANWTQRPNDALQRKTLARLCNRMFPLGTDGDDFLETASIASAKSLELEKALKEGLGSGNQTSTTKGPARSDKSTAATPDY